MPEAQKIPFLKLFSAWRPGDQLAAMTQDYLVTRAVIDKHTRSIKAQVECANPPAEDLRRTIERSIALAYRVERVEPPPSSPRHRRWRMTPPPLSAAPRRSAARRWRA